MRVSALGKSGEITALLKSLGAMDPETRAAEAPKIHALREAVTDAIADRKAALEAAELERKLATERIDLSLPAPESVRGHGPSGQPGDGRARRDLRRPRLLGRRRARRSRTQWYNFTALNMPENHPARAMQDTFYLEPRDAGRGAARAAHPHLAGADPGDARRSGAPICVIAPGRVYRSDSDATHTPMFHQVEGLVIDRGITLGHLKWTLETFLKAFFERDDIVLRMRPVLLPVHRAVGRGRRRLVDGEGPPRRRRAAKAGWRCSARGMVHPRVIANCGLDPDEWQGFAFGCGIDRLAMLKYGMDDLRAFFDGDIRWLKHYGFRALDVPTLSGGVGA